MFKINNTTAPAIAPGSNQLTPPGTNLLRPKNKTKTPRSILMTIKTFEFIIMYLLVSI